MVDGFAGLSAASRAAFFRGLCRLQPSHLAIFKSVQPNTRQVEDNNRFNWMAKTIAAVTVLVAVATVYWVVVGWNDMTNVTFTTNKWGVDGNWTS